MGRFGPAVSATALLLVTACGGSGDGGLVEAARGGGNDPAPASSAAAHEPAAPLSKQGVKQALLQESDFGYGWEVAPDEEPEGADEEDQSRSDDPECQRAFNGQRDLVSDGLPGNPVAMANRSASKGDAYGAVEPAWVVGVLVMAYEDDSAERLLASVAETADACNGETTETGDGRTSVITKITVPERGDESAGMRVAVQDGTLVVDTVLVREGANLSFLLVSGYSLSDDVQVEPDDQLAAQLLDKAATRLHDAVASEQG